MAKKKSDKTVTETVTEDGVTVRMFCQGLGDCFLLSFPQQGQKDYHVWIDCGVAMGTANAEAVMSGVVNEIKKLTGGFVDLLVITHEHWDHVSGFVQADSAAFAGLEVGRLWLAWTEDPKDELAKVLKKDYGKAKLALARAMNSKSGLSKTLEGGLEGLKAFYGPGDFVLPGMKVSAAAKASTGDGMKKARDLVKSGSKGVNCLMPGEITKLPGASAGGMAAGVKAFVLGPPHDLAMVRKEDSKTETYHKKGQGAFGAVPWNWVASLNAGGSGPSASEALPFEEKLGMSLALAKKEAFFNTLYFSPPKDSDAVAKEAHAQRRIDEDWMDRGTQQLALALNKYMNNISLVLAFELPATKKVLLFVGDAQVGNWLSWHDLSFKVKDDIVTAQDLLARTALYKVGHHGSHNATLREKGLEMMTHPELVAMLPVDAKQATTLGYGEMPLESLQSAINDMADERLLRLDCPWTGTSAPGEWRNLNKPKLKAAKDISYMEYVVRDD
jgi:beta-lactamase superfamily II metal-dependent hydrolase